MISSIISSSRRSSKKTRMSLHIQVLSLFVVPVMSAIAWGLSIDQDAITAFNLALVFFAFSVSMIWVLPALRGPSIGYPLQVISAIWFIVYGIGARTWLLEGNPMSITVVYAGGFAVLALASGYLFGKYAFGAGRFIETERVLLHGLKRRALLFVLLSGLATLYFVAVGGIPAFHSNALVYRFEVRERVSSYVVFMLRSSQLPLYAIWAMYQLGYIKKTLRNQVLIWSAVILVLFVNFIPGWRNPLMLVAFNLVFIYVLAHPTGRRLGLVVVGAASVAGILVMGFMRLFSLSQTQTVGSIAYFSQFTTDPFTMFFLWASAQFSNYTLGFLTSLSVFPSLVGYLKGGVIVTTLATMLPGHQELLDEKIKRWSGMNFDGAGLNLTILGESYADFGFFGVVFYPFMYGLILGILIRNVERSATPSRVVLAAFAASALSLGSLTGLLALSNFWILGGFMVFIMLGERITLPHEHFKTKS